MINVKRTFASEFFAFGALEMALEKKNILSWGLLTTHIFSKAIPDHFLSELSIFLLRVACSGHSEAKKSGNQNDLKSGRPSMYFVSTHLRLKIITVP